jgi:hypothetical protein
MATKREIMQAIKSRVEDVEETDYSSWRIGITHDPIARRQQHEAEGRPTKYWKCWKAESLSDAQDVESHFINSRNMKGGTGGDMDARKTIFVYIF